MAGIIGQIIKGHANEFFGLNKDISSSRLEVCKKCPLYSVKYSQAVCNSSLYLNPETNEVSTSPKPGFKKGCGCRLHAKTTVPEAACPLGKW